MAKTLIVVCHSQEPHKFLLASGLYTVWPKNFTSAWPNSLLVKFIVRWASFKVRLATVKYVLAMSHYIQSHHQYSFAPDNPCYHLVYHSLKCGWCIMHAKRHYSVLIQPLRGHKGWKFCSTLGEGYLPISFQEIQYGHRSCFSHMINTVLYSG